MKKHRYKKKLINENKIKPIQYQLELKNKIKKNKTFIFLIYSSIKIKISLIYGHIKIKYIWFIRRCLSLVLGCIKKI